MISVFKRYFGVILFVVVFALVTLWAENAKAEDKQYPMVVTYTNSRGEERLRALSFVKKCPMENAAEKIAFHATPKGSYAKTLYCGLDIVYTGDEVI